MSKKITINHHNGHEFVEIGGLKWATCNVGAEKPTDTGLYFQWGDRKGYTADEVGKVKRFDLNHYKHYNGNRWTKYNGYDGKLVLDLCDDAAFAYMGQGWRMPIQEDISNLMANAITTWTYNYQNSGVTGMVFTDITDNTKELFFPAAGSCASDRAYDLNSYGCYWYRSLYLDKRSCANRLFFNFNEIIWNDYSYRDFGFTVRGILTA